MTIRVHPSSVTATLVRKQLNNVVSYSSNTYNLTDTFIGGDKPQWREIIARGEEAGNNLTATRTFVELSPCDFSYDVVNAVTGLKIGSESIFGIPEFYGIPTDSSHDPTVASKALSRFNSKLSSVIAPFKGGVFFGELRGTLGMIRTRGTSLLSSFEDYIKYAKKLSGKRALKDINNLYLEYTFGWKPLIKDIGDAASSLLQDRSLDRKIVGSADNTTASNRFYGPYAYGGQGFGRYNMTSVNSVKSSCRYVGVANASLVDRPSGSILSLAESRLGLRLSEFVPTIWELIPYSFVVDYFANIGGVLEGAFIERSALRWVSRTKRCVAVNKMTWQPAGSVGSSSWKAISRSQTPGYLWLGRKSLDRDTPGSLMPDFVVTMPTFGSTKYLNMAALVLAGALRR